MKKLLFVGMVFGALALTSCKKDYKCTYGTGDTKIVKEFNNLTNDQAKVEKDKCTTGLVTGVWEFNL